MNASDKARIKDRIDSLLLQLDAQQHDLDDSSKPVTLDQTKVGRLSRMDAMQMQQMQLRNAQANRRHVAALKLARQRLERDDDFGLCQACDEPIALKRLLIDPSHHLCIQCAENISRD